MSDNRALRRCVLNYRDMTWKGAKGAADRDALLLLPVGSLEQHGPHLPLSTDSLEVSRWCGMVADRRPAVVLPCVEYTVHSRPKFGGAGGDFPGSVGIPGSVLCDLVMAVLRDLFRQGFRQVAVLNGHWENTTYLTDAIGAAVTEWNSSKVLLINWWELVAEVDMVRLMSDIPGGFRGWEAEHAGTIETSLVQYFEPGLVRTDLMGFAGGAERRPGYDIFPTPGDVVPKSGVMGSAVHATEGLGHAVALHVVELIIDVLEAEFPQRPANH